MKAKDLTGSRFGKLTAIKPIFRSGRGYYLCKCDCGKEKEIYRNSLISGATTSCGCYIRKGQKKPMSMHGLTYHPLYKIWAGMMRRCYDINHNQFKNYGERGIIVDIRWHDVSVFIKDTYIGYEKGLQLDRINNKKGYCVENFRWATPKENCRNKRNNRHLIVNGIDLVVAEWSEITGIHHVCIEGRIRKGLDGLVALYGKRLLKNNKDEVMDRFKLLTADLIN